MSHYAILPKLPVPPLSGSLDRFMSALRPLLSPRDFSEAVRVTGTFSEGQGPHLQARLERLAEETDNWASHVWVQTRYLTNRSPLPLTNGSSAILTPYKWTSMSDVLSTISRYTLYMVQVTERVRTGRYPQEVVGGVPLCMAQYRHMAGGHRLPGLTTDSYCQSPDSRHIIVMHAGSMYKVPVYLGGRECPVSVQEMYGLLSQVLTDTQREGHRSVGLLTALERDQWYSAREQLMESPLNRETLRAVETCLFGVCLDQSDAGTPTGILKQSRFGDRTGNFESFNRWFGLACQAVFTRDGWLGWVSEHSMLDGGAISLFAGLPDLSEPVEPSSDTGTSPCEVELLSWDISPSIQARLQEARLFLSGCYHKYDIETFSFSEYGREFLRRHDVYFQGYIQLALQLAYYKLYHGLAATYQPVSLRAFRCGRLEQPHTVSAESVAFVEAMSDRTSSDRERHALMLSGIKRHREIATETAHGNVYLKHFQALKLLAEKEQLQIELFHSTAYRVFTTHKLSVSSVYSPIDGTGIYLPPSGEGHFFVFQPHDVTQVINFAVCTVASSPSYVASKEFCSTLRGVLMELRQVVLAKPSNGVSSKL